MTQSRGKEREKGGMRERREEERQRALTKEGLGWEELKDPNVGCEPKKSLRRPDRYNSWLGDRERGRRERECERERKKERRLERQRERVRERGDRERVRERRERESVGRQTETG